MRQKRQKLDGKGPSVKSPWQKGAVRKKPAGKKRPDKPRTDFSADYKSSISKRMMRCTDQQDVLIPVSDKSIFSSDQKLFISLYGALKGSSSCTTRSSPVCTAVSLRKRSRTAACKRMAHCTSLSVQHHVTVQWILPKAAANVLWLSD